jgi:hypothetical protein
MIMKLGSDEESATAHKALVETRFQSYIGTDDDISNRNWNADDAP